MNAETVISLGKEPISADAPTGTSARYEAEFAALEEELAKQESLTAQAIDWNRVVELATQILGSQSKDLLVAAYLTRGLQERQGIAGLATGLTVMRDMSANFWDDMFPPARRLRARATAVQWMAEKCGARLAEKPPGSSDDDAVRAAAEALAELDGLLVEKMPDDPPSLRELSKPLQDMTRAAESRASQPAAAPAAPAGDAEAAPTAASAQPAQRPATPASAAPGEIANDNDARKALRGIQDIARRIADFWLAQKPTDPRAFRLTRMATWLLIDQPPPAENGRTQLNPPAAERVKAFQLQFEQGQFDKLIPELELSVARTPFWLDGQHLSFRALSMLGPAGTDAAQSVQSETLHFLERLPAMLELSFSDGTPFANDETRLWLEEARGSASENGSSDASTATWRDALKGARTKASKGELPKALADMQAELAGAASAQERFHWRFALAELLAGSGQHAIAASLLESLAEEIEMRRLDEWDPPLAVRVFVQLVQCYRKAATGKKATPDAAVKLESAHARLSRLDPAAALNT